MAGFLLSGVWTLHRTPFDDSSHPETHPCGASASAVQRCCRTLVRVRAPLFKETSRWLVFCFRRLDSPSNSVRWFVSFWDSPLRGQRKRCSTVLSHLCPSPGTLSLRTNLSRGPFIFSPETPRHISQNSIQLTQPRPVIGRESPTTTPCASRSLYWGGFSVMSTTCLQFWWHPLWNLRKASTVRTGWWLHSEQGFRIRLKDISIL